MDDAITIFIMSFQMHRFIERMGVMRGCEAPGVI